MDAPPPYTSTSPPTAPQRRRHLFRSLLCFTSAPPEVLQASLDRDDAITTTNTTTARGHISNDRPHARRASRVKSLLSRQASPSTRPPAYTARTPSSEYLPVYSRNPAPAPPPRSPAPEPPQHAHHEREVAPHRACSVCWRDNCKNAKVQRSVAQRMRDMGFTLRRMPGERGQGRKQKRVDGRGWLEAMAAMGAMEVGYVW